MRDYEDSVMNGNVPKAAVSRKSPDSSPDVPKPKRIRTEVINVDSEKKTEVQDKETALKQLQSCSISVYAVVIDKEMAS